MFIFFRTLFPPDVTEDMTMMMFKLSDLDPEMRPMQFSVEDVDKLCSAYKYLVEQHPGLDKYNYRASRKVLSKNQTTHVNITDLEEDFMQQPEEDIVNEKLGDSKEIIQANF